MLARAAAFLLVLGSVFGVAPSARAAVVCDGHRATLVGTRGDDVLTGTRGDDVIAGLTGSDSIDGRGGNDRICGGYGADQLRGGPGRDRIFGGPDRVAFDDEGSASIGDTLRGGPGGDRLVPGLDTRPVDDVNHDAIVWDTSPRSVHIDAAAGVAAGDGPDSFVGTATWLVGSRFGDVIDGSVGPDLLNGAQGADVVRAGAGADTVLADTSGGSGGDDQVWGGPGDDRLSSLGGQDVIHGGLGDDVIDDTGNSADVLAGEAGNDLVIGEIVRSDLPQVYAGGPGHDQMSIFSNLLNPTAAPSRATWDMGSGDLVVDSEGPQHLTASGFEEGDLSTFGAAWNVRGTDGNDMVNVGSMRGSTFLGLGGNDSFLGTAFDDSYDGGAGTDRSLGMGDGFDTCVSVEVLAPDGCESVSP
jgi:Ca2+-binding RTX toxin-like protein